MRTLSLSDLIDMLDEKQDAMDKLIEAYFRLEAENSELRARLDVITRTAEQRLYNQMGVH